MFYVDDNKKSLEGLNDYDNYFYFDENKFKNELALINGEIDELNELKHMCYSNKENSKSKIITLNNLIEKFNNKIEDMEYGSRSYQIDYINFYKLAIKVLKIIRYKKLERYKSSVILYKDLSDKIDGNKLKMNELKLKNSHYIF